MTTEMDVADDTIKVAATPAVSRERMDYLDSMRGVAAFIVVICHYWRMVPQAIQDSKMDISTIFLSFSRFCYYFLNKLNEMGRMAVILFFVLSGFVLALSLQSKHTPYRQYVVKRLFRIYPLMVVVILFSFAAHWVIGVQHTGISSWYDNSLHPDLGVMTIVKHLAVWGGDNSNSLDGPLWTLIHEIRISLIFPLVLYSVIRLGWTGLLPWIAVCVGANYYILEVTGQVILGYHQPLVWWSWIDSAHFIIFFAIGALLMVRRNALVAWLSGFHLWQQCALLAVALALILRSTPDSHFMVAVTADYLRALAAVILIASAMSFQWFSRLLSKPVLLWLGHISYSLYLTHMPVIYVIEQLFGAGWSTVQTALVTLPACLLVAHLSYRFIELPGIALGKRACARLATRQATC